MRTVWFLLILMVLPPAVFAEGKPLPRGIDALGIAVPVSLDMAAGDLDRIKGTVTKNGKFVTITTDSGCLLSINLNGNADRLVKIVVQLRKDQYAELLRTTQEFSAENQYKKEKAGHNEIHTWNDTKTLIRLAYMKDFFRLDLMDLKEVEE